MANNRHSGGRFFRAPSRRLSRRLPVMVLGVCFLVISGVGSFAGLALRGALYEQLDTSLNQSVNQLAQIARTGQGKEVLGTPLAGEEETTPHTDSSKIYAEDADSLKTHGEGEAANRISRTSKIPDSLRGQPEEKQLEKPDNPGRGHPGRDFPGITAGSFSLIYQAGQATSLLVEPGQSPRQLSSTQVSQVLSLSLTRPQNVSLTDLGDYRVAQRQVDTPEGTARIASGLPLREVNQTLHSFILFYSLGSLAALLGAYLLARFLVRRELRDLTQVEKVARTVENVNLESESHLPTRVRDEVTSKDSEAAQLGRSLNRALEHVESSLKLREKSEAQLRQFVADASHELRTPVAAISGYAQLLARQNLGEQAGDAVGRIERESHRLADLVSDLILLARLDAGQNAQVEEVSIAGVIVETFTNMRITHPEHHW
ncbi:histidine kinase dimerization/phospho-acceptor domain-containing protein [uncultured Varibaculum sp.]|uniref:histidine kinase dimerization/phospho-acceptor domain-containing protein n=1 Tax=uncultured Varibaculum sp. TaxID=413896 RepID=UPI0026759695|nr:histidine kinase dimerization/phospho-acceptor domain-containing protein [uncultured Varibaculum sp.]